MDLTATIVPRSDQLNGDDLLAGPMTVTIADVREGSAEQPVNIELVGLPGRPFRPSKTVLRILVTAWGKESSAYIGRRMTLYRDPVVKFGGQEVGGIRVSHLSHIDKPMKLALTATRGKKDTHIVKPLADEPANRPTAGRPEIKPNVEALIENAQEARDNADLDDVARAAAGLTGEELDAVKAVVTARRAELKEAGGAEKEPAEPALDGDWPTVTPAGGAK